MSYIACAEEFCLSLGHWPPFCSVHYGAVLLTVHGSLQVSAVQDVLRLLRQAFQALHAPGAEPKASAVSDCNVPHFLTTLMPTLMPCCYYCLQETHCLNAVCRRFRAAGQTLR